MKHRRRIDTWLAKLKARRRGEERRPHRRHRRDARHHRRPDGSPVRAGDTWAQPDLATTLEAIAQRGAAAFYAARWPRRWPPRSRRWAGCGAPATWPPISAIERKPIVFDYRGYRVVTMPPPSAGGVTLRQIFAASETLKLVREAVGVVDSIHLYIEALRRVYADRNQLLADPAFVEIPMKQLLDADYMRRRLAKVDRAARDAVVGGGRRRRAARRSRRPRTSRSSTRRATRSPSPTRSTAASAPSVAVPGTGVHPQQRDGRLHRQAGHAQHVRPGAGRAERDRAAASGCCQQHDADNRDASDGKLRAVCGAPGGPTISTTVAQIVLQRHRLRRPTRRGRSPAPRIHHQWMPDMVFHEKSLDPEIAVALAARGHVLKSRGVIGHANCIEVDPKTGEHARRGRLRTRRGRRRRLLTTR